MTNTLIDSTSNSDVKCTTLAFNPDGQVIASGFNNGIIRLWSVESKKEMIVLSGHKENITSLCFSNDGKYLISGCDDRKISVWDVFTGDQLRIWRGHKGAITSLAINPDNSILASGGTDNRIKLWSATRKWKKMSEFTGHDDAIARLAFSPKEDHLVSTSWDHTIRIWLLDRRFKSYELKGHFGPVYGLAFTKDGSKFYTCSSDGLIKKWDGSNGDEYQQLTSLPVALSSLTVSSKNPLLAVGTQDNSIRIWNYSKKKPLKKLTKHNHPIKQVLFSPIGKELISLDIAGILHLWSVEDILRPEEKPLLEKVVSAVKNGEVKPFLENLWEQSLGKLITPPANQKKHTAKTSQKQKLHEKMMRELPLLIKVLKDGYKLKVSEIQKRYNCSKEQVEEVIVELLTEDKIQGSFNAFSEIFVVSKDKVKKIKDMQEYKLPKKSIHICFYCGEPLKEDLKKCPACGQRIAICPVCKLPLSFNDIVGVCTQCGVNGHFSHMKEAAKVTGQCPVCQEEIDWSKDITKLNRSSKK